MNVRICPKCNSPDTMVDSLMDRKYRCRNCGFLSTLFPELIVKNAGELKKLKIKKRSK